MCIIVGLQLNIYSYKHVITSPKNQKNKRGMKRKMNNKKKIKTFWHLDESYKFLKEKGFN